MRPLLSILPPAMLLLSLPVVVGFAANPWVSVDDSDYRLLLMCDGKTTAACYFANHTEHVETDMCPAPNLAVLASGSAASTLPATLTSGRRATSCAPCG